MIMVVMVVDEHSCLAELSIGSWLEASSGEVVTDTGGWLLGW